MAPGWGSAEPPYYLRSDPVQPRVTYPNAPPLPDVLVTPARPTRETALWVWKTATIMRDADAQSFYNLGPAAMRAATGEIVRYLEGEPAFAGLAFHDYAGLSHLLSREESSR